MWHEGFYSTTYLIWDNKNNVTSVMSTDETPHWWTFTDGRKLRSTNTIAYVKINLPSTCKNIVKTANGVSVVYQWSSSTPKPLVKQSNVLYTQEFWKDWEANVCVVFVPNHHWHCLKYLRIFGKPLWPCDTIWTSSESHQFTFKHHRITGWRALVFYSLVKGTLSQPSSGRSPV
jgi:hypothetical protein